MKLLSTVILHFLTLLIWGIFKVANLAHRDPDEALVITGKIISTRHLDPGIVNEKIYVYGVVELREQTLLTDVLVKRILNQPDIWYKAQKSLEARQTISVLDIDRGRREGADACNLALNDTCIFSLTPVPHLSQAISKGDKALFIPLAGSAYKISLPKIDSLTARIKRDSGPPSSSIPYMDLIPSHPTRTNERPCEIKLCSHGSICVEVTSPQVSNNQTNIRNNGRLKRSGLELIATCVCSTVKICSSKEVGPVCATNQVIYLNKCYLSHAACRFNLDIYPIPESHEAWTRKSGKSSSLSQVLSNFSNSPEGSRVRFRKPIDNTESIHNLQFKDVCNGVTCHYGAICVNVTLPVYTSNSSSTHSSFETIPGCTCPDVGADECQVRFGDDDFTGLSVCGSDGMDYRNLCQLKSTSCRARRDIRVKHIGKCEPCKEVQCDTGTGEICKTVYETTESGVIMRRPICTCQNGCRKPGATLGLLGIFRPFSDGNQDDGNLIRRSVCGTDGKLYGDVCRLEVEACISGDANLTLLSTDPAICSHPTFNPCQGRHINLCPPYTSCRASGDNPRHYECRCPYTCEPIYAPVCGSDNVTYDSYCHLQVHLCEMSLTQFKALNKRSQTRERNSQHLSKISIAHYGPCVNEQAMNYSLRDETKIAKFSKMLCGNNGDCRQKLTPGSLCVVLPESVGEQASSYCACPSCADQDANSFKPICGGDGITYYNECHLSKYSCLNLLANLSKSIIKQKSEGLCPMKCLKDSDCDFYGICQFGSPSIFHTENIRDKSDRVDALIGNCQCTATCKSNQNTSGGESKVCGTDGISYASECHLKRHSCKEKQFLVVAHVGPCQGFCQESKDCPYEGICHEGHCQCPLCTDQLNKSTHLKANSAKIFQILTPSRTNEVCGSDGITYANLCRLRKKICENKVIIEVLHNGSCEDYPNTEPFKSRNDKIDDLYPIASSQRYKKSKYSMPVNQSYLIRPKDEVKVVCDESTNCRYGGKCLTLSATKINAIRCFCPLAKFCDFGWGDNFTCGTDGHLYKNKCHLQRFACLSQTYIAASNTFEPCIQSLLIQASLSCLKSPDNTINNINFSSNGYLDDKIKSRCCFNFNGHRHSVSFGRCETMGLTKCGCNAFGSLFPFCHDPSGRCICKPNVVGQRCDKCRPNYYGIHRGINERTSEWRSTLLQQFITEIGAFISVTKSTLTKNASRQVIVANRSIVERMIPFLDRIEGLSKTSLRVYDGLREGVTSEPEGCLPCNCSPKGSRRLDCEQSTGRCMCRARVIGFKCDICPYPPYYAFDNSKISANLSPWSTSKTVNYKSCPFQSRGKTCSELGCQNYAVCLETLGQALCVCDTKAICEGDAIIDISDETGLVCGSDERTYASLCQLKLISCHAQAKLTVKHKGHCNSLLF